MHPRGSVTLKSAHLRDAPIIDPNPFAGDLERAIDSIEIRREILSQPVFVKYISREYISR
ncbi:hypothetical protein ACWGTO_08365 [Mesorhizobium sp. PL10]